MRHFPNFLIHFFLAGFFIIPILGGIEDPRGWTKIFSFVFLSLFIFSTLEKKENQEQIIPKTYTQIKPEIRFTFLLLSLISFVYLQTLFQHLNSFFLVDYDFIAIAEILNNSLSGDFFRTHHYGKAVTGNYLSHHFSPCILILAPFMLLSKFRLGYAYGLLFFVLLSYILFGILLIRRNIRGNIFYLIMILLAVNINVHRLFFSYHFELLTIFFFLIFFIGIDFHKIYISFFSILALLLLKEDIAIYTACLGLFFLSQRKWRYAAWLIVTSLLYFFFVPVFFQNQFDKSTHIDWLKDWSHWGNSYSEILINLFSSPIQVLEAFFSKWKILKEFLFSFSPLILIYPSIIIISLPLLTLHFISNRAWYNTLYNYYSYTVAPFFILGLLFSIQRLQESKYKQYTKTALLFSIALSLYSSSGDKMFPYAKIPTDAARVTDIEEIVKDIPIEKTIAAQFDLGAFIPRANPLFPLHEKNLDKDYLLLDKRRGITPYVDKERIEKMILLVTANHSYALKKEKNGIMLYEKINQN